MRFRKTSVISEVHKDMYTRIEATNVSTAGFTGYPQRSNYRWNKGQKDDIGMMIY